jgi:hypothetical protein
VPHRQIRAAIRTWFYLGSARHPTSASDRISGDTLEGRKDAIYQRAVEHFVAEAISGIAAEDERIERNKIGCEPSKQLITAQLRGSFPDTVLRLKWYMRVSDREMTSELKIWNRDEFNAACWSIEPLRNWIEGLLFKEIHGADP